MINTISTGNEEIDRQFGGGIPTPSFVFIEGDHGTGKSAISAQIMTGLLASKENLLCVIENTVTQYIQKMKSITFNFSKPFVRNQLIFVPIYVKNARWSEKNTEKILPIIEEFILKKLDLVDGVIIDSISPLVINSNNESILGFLSFCKEIVTKGKTIILTSHSSDFSKSTNTALVGAADVYLKLGTVVVGDKEVKTLKIIKLLGAKDSPEAGFAFEVDMIFGIKIVPVSMANA
ncbi:ATPase domain-containing protein [Nitrosopumilus ureiphilus]|uniref:ATPase n=1 Tax=Nitrosopumilus ureiphilus TaxID=1470067 RepID=A0A7D5M623_9ARCH|nr:ATPase domain-containing protein [Nitrosopumilus ureiphilus]QLH06871.1 ATPase [Nitrosopumilus ureiphilus]